MIELITQTARLVPYAKRPKQVPSFVLANTYEPEVDDPSAQFGSLFIILEALINGRAGEAAASVVVTAFHDTYYASDGADDSITRFEAATKAVNTALLEHVNQGNAAWIGKLSAIICVQCKNELHVTHIGSAEAFLYRGKATTRITTGTETRASGPAKTFGSIASGTLEAGDHLLLATPALIHQMALPKLHDVVSSNTAATAISEITELLRGTDTTRIAALVVDITTPELAALRVRTDQPTEIMVGTPDSALEAARLAAAPIAEAAVTTSKRAGRAAQTGWERAKPRLSSAGLAAAGTVRAAIAGEKIARRGLIGLGLVALFGLGLVWYMHSNTQSRTTITRYTTAYNDYTAADTAATPASKRTELQLSLTTLQPLTTPSKLAATNRALLHAKLPNGAPHKADVLETTIQSKIDSLDGVHRVNAAAVLTLPSPNSSEVLEATSSSLYLINKDNAQINVVNKSTKYISKGRLPVPAIGPVTSSTLSSAGDGIYLLTNHATVWLYRFSNASYSELSLGGTGWEPGTAIASYSGNLYIATSDAVYKHVRTSTGFAPGVKVVSTTAATSMTVDGYIYTATTSGLTQYLSGSVAATDPTRGGLDAITRLHSDASAVIIGVDHKSGRIGQWNDDKTLVFDQQFAVNGLTSIDDALYDPTSGLVYATSSGKVWQFSVK